MRAPNTPSHRQAPCPGKMSIWQAGGGWWKLVKGGGGQAAPEPPPPPSTTLLNLHNLRFQSVLPYKDENPTELTPLVTVGIIVINVVVWLFVQGAGAAEALGAPRRPPPTPSSRG